MTFIPKCRMFQTTLSLRLWIWNNTPLWVSNMSCHFKEFDKLFRAHSCTASYLYFMCSNWMTEFSHNTIWHCTENEVNWFTASISLSPTSCTETSRRPRFLMGHTGLEGALGEFHCKDFRNFILALWYDNIFSNFKFTNQVDLISFVKISLLPRTISDH